MPDHNCRCTSPVCSALCNRSKPPTTSLQRSHAFALTLLAALVIVLGFTGCEPASVETTTSNQAAKTPEAIEVKTMTVIPKVWPTVARSQGSLIADEETIVSTKVAGRVSSVLVDLGDVVEGNQPLILIDPTEFKLQADQAKARLDQARAAVGLTPNQTASDLSPKLAPPVRQEKAIWEEAKNSLARAESLLSQGAISRGEYDIAFAAERAAEARHAAALNGVQEKIATIATREAELAIVEHQIEETTIHAPFGGYVKSRNVAPGTYLSIGEPVISVVRTDPLRFCGTLPERYAQLLEEGLKVKLELNAPPHQIEAKITRVSPTLDDQSRALSFEADIANPDQVIRAGLFAEAEVIIDPDATSLTVPISAVQSFAGVQKVWKVVEDQAVEQEVLLGSRRGNWIEITSGIQAGDEIVIESAKGKRALVTRIGDSLSNAKPMDPSSEPPL